MARWALRLFVRERRQQLLTVGVIAVAIAAGICSVATVFNLADSDAARFGTAEQRFQVSTDDPADLSERLETYRAHLGTVELIGHVQVPVPGAAEAFDGRLQDPHGVFASSTLRLRDGRLPATATEAAVTDAVARTLAVGIGDVITIEGATVSVVGRVENPLDLADQFVLLAPEPAATFVPDSVTVLADASTTQLDSLRTATSGLAVELRTPDVSKAAATATLAAFGVVFLLVALVAAAGFAVVAQRRRRQLGMLASIGATDRQLGSVLIVHGALVGVAAAVGGALLGIGGWFAIAHRLESSAGHRIDASNLPWVQLLGAVACGVLVPIAAAWWPARALARTSIIDAISERPPRPKRADRSLLLAILLLAHGVALAALSDQTNAVLLLSGVAALIVGILLACPMAIRLLARAATRAPVTVRVALRDLGRYQARAGAALAAISLALGIPVAIVLIASAADQASAESAGNGNLAPTQLLIRIDRRVTPPAAPNLSAEQLASMQAEIDQLAATLGDATVVPLTMALASGNANTTTVDRPLIDLAVPVDGDTNHFHATTAFVATPELMAYLGTDLSQVPASTEVLTTDDAAAILVGTGKRDDTAAHARIDPPAYTSLPSAFITPAAMEAHRLQATTVGWIVEAPHAVTAAQLTAARHTASGAGFSIEARHGPVTRGAIRSGATAAGAAFALAIVAMTVGTIRSEAAAELHILTASGATSRIRRGLTAATAASLALCGVILGTAGAYLGSVGAYAHHLHRLSGAPVSDLVAALIGVPLLSGALGWCLGGREPRVFSRSPAA